MVPRPGYMTLPLLLLLLLLLVGGCSGAPKFGHGKEPKQPQEPNAPQEPKQSSVQSRLEEHQDFLAARMDPARGVCLSGMAVPDPNKEPVPGWEQRMGGALLRTTRPCTPICTTS